MSDARTITLALGGRWHESYGLAPCPVPTHGRGRGDRNPSLSIRDGDTGVLFTCHAGCDRLDVFDEILRRGLLGDCPAPARARHAIELPVEREPDPDGGALELWRASAPIGGTLAETYLRGHRGLAGPFPRSLRYRPDVHHPHSGAMPALIAAVQRPDRHVVAVQATFLRPVDGAKARIYAPRITIGRLGTGAVRLAPAGEVLGIAEGVETALSAMQLTGIPCWATLGGQRLARLTLPPEVREVIVFGDDDDAGRLLAERAAGRYTRNGLHVVMRWPPRGCGDWNDAIRARAGSATA